MEKQGLIAFVAGLGALAFIIVAFLGGIVFYIGDALSPRHPVIEGHADVIDGDKLRIGHTTIRLFGIDAPELGQICTGADGKVFDCGEAARSFLAEAVSHAKTLCREKFLTPDGRVIGDCKVRGVDLGRQMVIGGYALAFRQFSDVYAGREIYAEARNAGLWRGRFTSPSEHRSRLLAAANVSDLQTLSDGHLIHDPMDVIGDHYRDRLEVMYFWANICLLFITILLFAATIAGFAYARRQLKVSQDQQWAGVILTLDDRLESPEMERAMTVAGHYFEALRKELLKTHSQDFIYTPSDELFEETSRVMNLPHFSRRYGYAEAIRTVSFCETIGHLVEQGYLSRRDAYGLFGGYLKEAYLRMEGAIRVIRADRKDQQIYANFSRIGQICFDITETERNSAQ